MRKILYNIILSTHNILPGLVLQGTNACRRRVIEQRRHRQVETVSVRFTEGRLATGNHS